MLASRGVVVWVFFALVALLLEITAAMKIAAFNVQVFGNAKINKPHVVEVLVKIVRRYDIILIQEIRDSKGKAIEKLLEEVNEEGPQYKLVISERLGRTSSKEQYAFLYKQNTGIVIEDTYQYEDPGDKFEREPFAVKIRSKTTEVTNFVLVAIHIDPDEAVDEINRLTAVHEAVKERWNIDNILILGDFNADGSYVSKKKLAQLDLRRSGYEWLIQDDVDTTVGKSDLAYDRFVMTGDDFLQGVEPGSAKVFRFDEEYGLSYDEAKEVSDHYPIELSLKPAPADAAEIEIGENVPSNAPQNTGILDSFINFFGKLCCCQSNDDYA